VGPRERTARRTGGARATRRRAGPDWDVDASQDTPRYAAGERVRHRKFGSGVVRAVSGAGRELKSPWSSTIGRSHKQLLVAYAGLEREWESA